MYLQDQRHQGSARFNPWTKRMQRQGESESLSVNVLASRRFISLESAFTAVQVNLNAVDDH